MFDNLINPADKGGKLLDEELLDEELLDEELLDESYFTAEEGVAECKTKMVVGKTCYMA